MHAVKFGANGAAVGNKAFPGLLRMRDGPAKSVWFVRTMERGPENENTSSTKKNFPCDERLRPCARSCLSFSFFFFSWFREGVSGKYEGLEGGGGAF